MRKIYFLAFLMLTINYLTAQPSLQWIRPPYGVIKYYSMYQGVMPAPTEGANQVWDYSSFNPTDIFGLQITDFNTLPQSAKSKFPSATYVEAMPGYPLDITIINYYQEYTDSLKRLGQQGSGGGLANTWGDIEAVFNISYGDSTIIGTKFKYAAYGTLKTKFGNYSNVVALKRATTTFLYQTSPYFAPLMQIEYYNGNIVGAYIYHYANSSGISHQMFATFAVFPNPVNNLLTIFTPEIYKDKTYVLHDIYGKKLLSGKTESSSSVLDISDLLPGYYFLTIENKTIKFIKQ
jgi:hypothetical protein